ncbi:tubby-like F-box protein 3 [Tanacetum coccineum]
MSFKSILQDMKGEFGSISRKGFGSRSRSLRVVEDRSDDVVVDAFKQSCWANMPPELLHDVLMRIEESEGVWPVRKNVVACAGVCRNWRELMKEIVKIPELSAKLTFPISLKQRGRGRVVTARGGDFCMVESDSDYGVGEIGMDESESEGYCPFSNLNITKVPSLSLWSVPDSLAPLSLPLSSLSDSPPRLPSSSTPPIGAASNDDGKFLLAAKKCRRATCTDYIISLNAEDVSKGSSTYIGKLRSNFLGTKFTVYDAQPPNGGALATKCRSFRPGSLKRVSPRVPAGNYPVSNILYELNVLGSRGPRRMQCVMNAIPTTAMEPGGVAPTQTEFQLSNMDSFSSLPFFRSKSARMDNSQSGSLSAQKNSMLMLKNKAPRWHEQLQCWCLNFNGRVTVASVKNFQLVASLENGDENVIIQFGKVGKDAFT